MTLLPMTPIEMRYEAEAREREAKRAREARPEVTVTVVPKTGLRRSSSERRSAPEPTKPDLPPGSKVLSAREWRAVQHMIETHPDFR